MEYQYPIDYEWTTEEMVDVIHFYEGVERAYEKGINREELMALYRRFKEIVPGKSQEKQLCNEFEEISRYSCYRVVQAAKAAVENSKIKM